MDLVPSQGENDPSASQLAGDSGGVVLCPHPDCVICWPAGGDLIQLGIEDVLFHVMMCEGG